MPPIIKQTRVAIADWRAFASRAIHAGVPTQQLIGDRLVAAAAADAERVGPAGPYPDIHRLQIEFPDMAAYGAVQAWRARHRLTWPEAIHTAAATNPLP